MPGLPPDVLLPVLVQLLAFLLQVVRRRQARALARLIAGPGPMIDTADKSAAFSIPIAATKMSYNQAEYPDQPGTVHLRPIAEQTGQPTTSWEVRFLTRERG